MDDIYEELQSDLREEKVKTYWKTYGRYIIVGLIALVASVVGYKVYNHFHHQNLEKISSKFFAAQKLIDQGDISGGRQALKTLITTTNNAAYRTLARLRLSSLPTLTEAERQKIYEEIIGDSSAPQSLRENVILMRALMLVDRATPAEVEAIQQDLSKLKNEAHPLAPLAHEVSALLHYQQKNYPAAVQEISQIMAHSQTSDQNRAQASGLLHQMTMKMDGAAKEAAPAAKPHA